MAAVVFWVCVPLLPVLELLLKFDERFVFVERLQPRFYNFLRLLMKSSTFSLDTTGRLERHECKLLLSLIMFVKS